MLSLFSMMLMTWYPPPPPPPPPLRCHLKKFDIGVQKSIFYARPRVDRLMGVNVPENSLHETGYQPTPVARIFFSSQAADGSRYIYGRIECSHSGKPRTTVRVKSASYRRREKKSRKVIVEF